MCSGQKKIYTESYLGLYHGTTVEFAKSIVSDQYFKPSREGWCGPGIYFYNIKAKAWWSAARTCEDQYEKTGIKHKPQVVQADIMGVPKTDIFDLRDYNSIKDFSDFVDAILLENSGDAIDLDIDMTDEEAVIAKRALLIAFYTEEKNKKLVIGEFKQRSQPVYEDMQEFANSWGLLYANETIFCVKDNSILSNIRIV